ncbi:MAG: hypothetical protein RIM99_04710 [Cyclobacteriaceae bacterium]
MNVQIDFVWQNLTDHLKKEVTDFWLAEKALNEEEANKRINQIVLIARGQKGEIIGVSSMVKRIYEPIGKCFWLFRAFVGEEYRRKGVVLNLISEAKKYLIDWYEKGNDPDVIGILLKVQSQILMKHFPEAIWPRTKFVFVGMEDGCHMRVCYFDGAKVS